MKKALEVNLIDLGDIMEDLARRFDKMTEAEKVDVAARLKPVTKACKFIDDEVKKTVKDKLKGKEGEVKGLLFKAILKLVPTKRLNQALLKEERPAIHEQYNEDVTDERVTFSLR